MKALSIRQPWLAMIFYLGKRLENRTRRPPASLVGQRIALHASKTLDQAAMDHWQYTSVDNDFKEAPGFELHTGAILGTARLAGVVSGICELYSAGADRPGLRDQSRWFTGPVAWMLEDVQVVEEPIPCSGSLVLGWDLPLEVERELLAAGTRPVISPTAQHGRSVYKIHHGGLVIATSSLEAVTSYNLKTGLTAKGAVALELDGRAVWRDDTQQEQILLRDLINLRPYYGPEIVATGDFYGEDYGEDLDP